VLDFRKHLAWYLAGYPAGADRRRRLAFATTVRELDAGFDEIDPDIALPPDAVGLPRGHTHGPRRVRLPEGWCDDVDDLTPPDGADLLVTGG
jgi:hypothetical protein